MLALDTALSPSERREVLEVYPDPVAAVRAAARGDMKCFRPEWTLPEWRLAAAETAMEVGALGGMIITLDATDYSADLREISDPPPVLYVRGRSPSGPGVAIVGSRECTSYGRGVAFRLAAELGKAGIPIISGLARGIDAAAHRGALESGTDTVAVLPCGIDRVYPPRHVALARHIEDQGALVSEFPLRTSVARWNFPRRNRLIAGLARVTVVVEAAERSGARITADLAQQYNREVLAVPGPITSPTSLGTNSLLDQGAYPCRSWRDVIHHLGPELEAAALARHEAHLADAPCPQDLPPTERACLEAIPHSGTCSSGEIAVRTQLAGPAILAALTGLEVRGLIRTIGGQRYERTAPEVRA
jgi:DNA processing protein